MDWEIGVDIYTQLCIKQTTTPSVEPWELHSVLCGDLNGSKVPKLGMYVYLIYVKLTDFTVQQKHNTAEQPSLNKKRIFYKT